MIRPRGASAMLIAPAASFLAALALYTLTLAPTVALIDSGELTVAAWSLGVAHPPGTPLYVLLAHLATRLPLGTVAVRVNLASALFAALAVAMMALAVAFALTTRAAPRRAPRREDPVQDAPHAFWIPALVAGLLLACSHTLWAYATVAEVYSLNTLMIVSVLALLLWWRRARLESPRNDTGDRALLAAALLFGLGLGVHVSTMGLMLPAFLSLVIATAGASILRRRTFAWAALCGLAGLSIYGYLPLAAAHDPVMNWGDPRDLERLIRHVTGRQYWVSFGASDDVLRAELATFGRLLAREFGPPWLPLGLLLAAAGARELLRRDRPLAVCLLLAVVADVAYSISYQIAEDKDGYYLPTFVALALAAGFGASWALRELRAGSVVGGGGGGTARRAIAALTLLAPVAALAGNLPFDDRSRFTLGRTYVQHALASVEPGGLLLTGDWQLYSPLFYLREVEALRRDVVAIDTRLLRRSWYYDYLRRTYPGFMAPHRESVDSFLSDLRAWEHDPARFEADAGRLRRIDDAFFGMIEQMLRRQLTTGRAYVTQDVVFMPNDENARLGKTIVETWSMVPQGLVMELRTDPSFVEPFQLDFDAGSVFGGRPRFEPEDVVRVKVLPVYAGMYLARGRYLAAYGRGEDAIASFRRALELMPDYDPARQALALALQAEGATPGAPPLRGP